MPLAEELHVWVLHSATELFALRSEVHQALTGSALREGEGLADIPERMALVATELATNAIKYGHPPTVVRLLRSDEKFVLDVADHDMQTVPAPVDARPDDAGGRGLQLAQAFSLDVGWYTTDTTKHVWASFDVHR